MKQNLCVLMGIIVATCSTGYALDTTEAFDPGFSDLEVYLGYTGLDSPSELSAVSTEALLGVGVTSCFSIFVSFGTEADGYLGNSVDSYTMGLFWTAVDREIFDMDFFGSTGNGGAVSFGVETNIDFARWGFQAQIEETVENSDLTERDLSTRVQPLVYFRLTSGVELLSAIDFEYAGNEEGDNEFDYSTISFGINFPVTESIEMISQFDINQTDDDAVTGASIGFVAGI